MQWAVAEVGTRDLYRSYREPESRIMWPTCSGGRHLKHHHRAPLLCCFPSQPAGTKVGAGCFHDLQHNTAPPKSERQGGRFPKITYDPSHPRRLIAAETIEADGALLFCSGHARLAWLRRGELNSLYTATL
jgi:hypothetical protein